MFGLVFLLSFVPPTWLRSVCYRKSAIDGKSDVRVYMASHAFFSCSVGQCFGNLVPFLPVCRRHRWGGGGQIILFFTWILIFSEILIKVSCDGSRNDGEGLRRRGFLSRKLRISRMCANMFRCAQMCSNVPECAHLCSDVPRCAYMCSTTLRQKNSL